MITSDLPIVEEIHAVWRLALGDDFKAYRNHVYRVVHLCQALTPLSEPELRQVQIAASFHDLGIWTHKTFDYVVPSVQLASNYLIERGHSSWIAPVSAMIEDHHKVRAAKDPLANAFRMADWIDVSMGALRFGVPMHEIREIRKAFPDEGFHTLLAKLSVKQLLTKPWNPLPMMRW